MTGHIRARGKGAWGLKFDVRSDTGERKTRYATVHGGKREAQRKLTELLDKANKGTLLEPSKETLADYLERWLRDWAAINVSPKTGERYGQLLRSYVSRHVGAVRLQKLGGAHLGELYALLMRADEGRKPLAPRTVRHVHRVLHKALAVAGEWGLIAGNPADRVKPPHVGEMEIEILAEVQVGQVLAKLGATLSIRSSPLRSAPACAAASCWRFPGATSISTPTRCGSRALWSKHGPGSASSRPKREAGVAPFRCPPRSPLICDCTGSRSKSFD